MLEKPMKPYKLQQHELSKLRYPLIATPKVDGIRCTLINGQAMSAARKPIANHYVREMIEHSGLPDGFDGELVTGCTFQETTSAIMSHDGEPTFEWQLFDWVQHETLPYITRMIALHDWFKDHKCPFTKELFTYQCHKEVELLRAEELYLDMGYEGLVARHQTSTYKNGRGTLAKCDCVALKRFTDDEAICIGVEELMHNGNEATINELGHTARSSARAGKVGLGMMGSLVCQKGDITFKVGTGFKQLERIFFWEHPPIGKLIKYKSLKIGELNAPRHPVFLGVRDPNDMTLK